MLNEVLVNRKLAELNSQETAGTNPWIAGGNNGNPMVFGAILLEKDNSNIFRFNPNSGLPMVIFVNQNTGEIKLFDARNFGLTV